MNCYICSSEIRVGDFSAECFKCGIVHMSNEYQYIKRLFLVPHTLIINNITIYLNIGVILYDLGYYIKSANLPNYIKNDNYYDTNIHLTEDEVKTYIDNIYRYIDNIMFT